MTSADERDELQAMSGPSDDLDHLGHACELALGSVNAGGGPFGAVVVRDAVVIATGTNRVTLDDDPTAHAEVTALRSAGAALGTHELHGCVLYASCRPCPMCMTAAWWARVERVVYAAESEVASAAGFDDSRFWAGFRDEVASPVRAEHLDHPESHLPFDAWGAHATREEY